MPGEALSLSERVQIEVGVAAGESARSIAGRLGREPSTITREMKRNDGRDAYSAAVAHTHADAQRGRPKATRFERDPAMAVHVEERLRVLDSPMTIAVELARGVYPEIATVSHETVYRGIYAHGRAGLAKGLHGCLHRRRRCRKHRHAPGQAPAVKGPLGDFNLIGLRPDEANRRDQVGHLEGGLICGSFNRSAIATLFDRTSRFVWLADLPDGHGAQAVLAALIETLERIPEELRRTLTWDQGSEMAAHAELAEATGIDVYFADPHSPWQRPTNENGNGLIRRYVAKGTNLNVYKTEDLRRIETRINTMPRRSLGWSTAHDVYHQAVALTV
jgi:IS30 family transposase